MTERTLVRILRIGLFSTTSFLAFQLGAYYERRDADLIEQVCVTECAAQLPKITVTLKEQAICL